MTHGKGVDFAFLEDVCNADLKAFTVTFYLPTVLKVFQHL